MRLCVPARVCVCVCICAVSCASVFLCAHVCVCVRTRVYMCVHVCREMERNEAQNYAAIVNAKVCTVP